METETKFCWKCQKMIILQALWACAILVITDRQYILLKRCVVFIRTYASVRDILAKLGINNFVITGTTSLRVNRTPLRSVCLWSAVGRFFVLNKFVSRSQAHT